MESEAAATVQATRPRRAPRTPVTAILTDKRRRKPKSNNESQLPFLLQQSQKATVDDTYSQWKTLLPILYDSFVNHTLVWPSLSCRWGPQLEQAGSKTQRLYLSEQVSLLLFLWFVHFFLMKNIQSLFTAPYVYRFFLVLSLDEWQCA
jgi:histone-binding protein RBBP4